MFKPIRRNLTCIYILTFFLFLVFILVIMFFTVQQVTEREQIKEINQYIKQEKMISRAGLAELRNAKSGAKTVEADHPYYFYIYKNDGTLLKGEELIPGLQAGMKRMVSGGKVDTGYHESEFNEQHTMYRIQTRRVPGLGTLYIVFGIDTTSAYHIMKRVLILFLFLSLVFTAILALISYFLSGKAIVPIQSAFEKQRKFVSDASHELRTPVSVFYSSTELLEKEEGGNLSDFGREVVADLKTEAKLMGQMLEDLLFLARSDQEMLQMRFEEVPLYELCTSIVRRFQTGLPADILMVNNILDHPVVCGDPTRLQELIYIFLENAKQYTEKGFIKLSLYQEKTFAVIEIKDSGFGIDAEDLPHIFERFYRGDKARVRDGTGLGLSIAETIVQKHRGRIEAASTPGKGTDFKIFIPIKGSDSALSQ